MTPENIIVSTLAECLAAFANASSGTLLRLQNPPFSIDRLGLLYLTEMVAAAALKYPGVPYHFICDCANNAPAVQAALAMGITDIRYQGPQEVTAKLEDIARQYGATLQSLLTISPAG
jgi:hypothetical protein